MSLNEFTPQQIKLAILNHLKNKYGGDYKYNIIGKADAPIGAIERHFELRFTNEHRHIASRCFDELRAEDLIRPTYSGNSNPEDWVDITDAGLAALESVRFDEQPTAATDIHLFRLKLLFMMADGSEHKGMVLTEVFKNENLSEMDVLKEASYMKGEGWIQILSSNGPPRVRLTHEGVKKAIDTPVFGSSHKKSSITPAPQPVTRMTIPIGTRNVFVVHGRNLEARNSLFRFLRSIGLKPLEWSQAIQATGKASPFIGEVLDSAFSNAQAVVVLFTPDDEARLGEQFRVESEPVYEIELTGQARPNVLFEAGMAMGRDPDRTVIVELGTLRPFSDIAGRHTIRLSNNSAARQELAERLRTAGCAVDLSGRDWHSEGDFDLQSVERKTVSVTPQIQNEITPIENTQSKEADRKLLDALRNTLPIRGSIGFIRAFNMAGFAFEGSRLDDLYNFLHGWDDVEHEFFDADLEEKRSRLYALIDEYTTIIGYETFPLKEGLQSVPSEWEEEQPERFARVVKQLHDKASEVVKAYDDLIRTARRKLEG